MMAGETTSRGETLEALRLRARRWADWEPLAVIEAEQEMDKSAEDPESQGQQVDKES